MQLQKAHLNITMDGQFGSTGKGLLNAYIAHQFEHKPDICVSNAAPNAGHTYVDDRGAKCTVFHLPVSGVLIPESIIYLCAGSIIDPILLEKEMKEFNVDPRRVYIHPRACIVLPEHGAREKSNTSGATSIASTQKGVGAALSDKVARVHGARTAGQYFQTDNSEGCRVEAINLMEEMDKRKTVLMEVPQGFSLSINHGLSYPECTSRDITVAAALNDAGVHPKYLGEVIVSLRSYPIRVGHIFDDEGHKLGDSGPFYADSDEKTFEELGQEPELTTVTKRVRRIATFSYREYKKMLQMNRPSIVFLNFCNYFQSQSEMKEVVTRMLLIEDQLGMKPRHLFGMGPAHTDVTDVNNMQALWDKIEEKRRGNDSIFKKDPNNDSVDYTGGGRYA